MTITPCLWFDFNAEAAVDHYLSIFSDSRVLEVSRYPDSMPGLAGKVLTIRFQLAGREFRALNGGPQFPFTEAVSLSVDCKDQTEVDHFWARLGEGGNPGQCGWIRDKFGLFWQIVPRALVTLLCDPDREKAARVMGAMMTMTKIEVAKLQAAYDG